MLLLYALLVVLIFAVCLLGLGVPVGLQLAVGLFGAMGGAMLLYAVIRIVLWRLGLMDLPPDRR